MNCKKIFIALLVIIATCNYSLKAQVFSENQKMTKSFACFEGSSLDIVNKYGKVQIINHDYDSVRIQIDITYKSNSLDKINKVKELLSFDITSTGHFIVAKTVFGKNQSVFQATMRDITEAFYTDNTVSIDFTVWMPEYINLSVDNKYGDFYIDNHRGTLNLKLSNGNIKANNIYGTSYIDHRFGNGTINLLTVSQMVTSYTDTKIKKSDQLNIDSKSSTINIDEVNVLKMESRRDKFFVNKVNNLYCKTYFTDCNIQLVSAEVNVNTKYGVYNLNSIPADFNYINLISRYSDINIFFEPGSGYDVDFEIKNTELSYPIHLAKIETTFNEKEKTSYIKGVIGNKSKNQKVKINAEQGNIVLSHK
ncbi:MAG: hypothetical protein A2W91_14090 [Bacteroidetes bacterium GWF2_38_335]|nr:MAG: hypothetical protein A2W91_14090 [Bacteroidetes bacterium GWF2_38_335]OFY77844.1 MAG: hypothetical protein A2281_15780 [Bacteroidetes bacterium RIFOXYA12_FULL_38_20]HBS87347.1 hypothetical protein [Bacteroidales bacterium]